MVDDRPVGTLTLVFTDIEDSTRLLRSLGANFATVLDDHRRLIRATFSEYGGTEVDVQGDGSFYVFPEAHQAARAAAEAQRALAAHPWPPDGQVRVRIGLHTGAPALTAEGYVGIDVHQAAR